MTYREDDRGRWFLLYFPDCSCAPHLTFFNSYEKPYLILDIRDRAQYDRGHLLQARSFPYTLLRRDQIPPELYNFRNKTGFLVIIYCDDEKVSREAAKTFVDRGTENIFLLTGGMNDFAGEFPCYIEGEVPITPAGRQTPRSSLGRIPEGKTIDHGSPDRRRVGSTTAASERGSPSSVQGSGALSHRSGRMVSGSPLTSLRRPGGSGMMSARSRADDRSDAGMSTCSNQSVAESVISRAASRKGRF